MTRYLLKMNFSKLFPFLMVNDYKRATEIAEVVMAHTSLKGGSGFIFFLFRV